MSNVQGVTITKTSGKLKGGPSGADRISALVAIVATAPSGLAFNTVAKIESMRDLPALGIDADYDTTNGELLYQNISEFFRLSPQGKLYLMCVDDANAPGAVLDDTGATMARKLLTFANAEVRQLAIMVNNGALAGTFVNGIPTEISAAIPKAQTFADWAYNTFKPCQVILECPDIQTPLSALGDLRAIVGTKAQKVSLVIGQDKAVADRGAAYANRAAIGACLGMISAKKVNEDIGWVGTGNLSDTAQGLFLSACLSNGTDIKTYEADWQSLDNKGYIFVFPYANIDGFYFNGDHTCVELSHDESSISRGRVKDKAVRFLRAALLPFVKSPQPVDPDTGKLATVAVENLNASAEKALDTNLSANGEISGRSVRVDPDSDLINAPKTLKVAFAIVPYGEIGEIQGTLEYVSSLQ